MTHRSGWIAAVAAAVCISAGTAACGTTSTTVSRRPAHGPLYGLNRALRIGVKADQPGIGMADESGTRFAGLDIDIANEIAAALHDTPVFQPVTSASREELLKSHAIDLIIASYSITEERLKEFDFAGPYLIAQQDILVRAGDTHITSVNDLRNLVTCGAAGSDSPRFIALRFGGNANMTDAWSKKHLYLVQGYGDCLPLLLDKTVDAVSTDNSILAGFANDPRYRGKVRLLGKPFTGNLEKYGIALNKGDPADVALINKALTGIIKDGTWERIVRKNLGDAASLFLAPGDIPSPPAGP
jgi:glutamate transport system substrate-binding protein